MSPGIRSLSIIVAGVSSVVSCASAPTNGLDESALRTKPLIQTDQSVYTARRGSIRNQDGTENARTVELSIGLRYTNRTAGNIYLPTCNSVHPPLLEKKAGSSWVVAYAPIVQACLGWPVVLKPGQVYQYQYEIQGFAKGGPMHPHFNTEVPGTYRLNWKAYETWDPDSPQGGLGRELPLSARISNEFQVVE
jgi:hypothetical protein